MDKLIIGVALGYLIATSGDPAIVELEFDDIRMTVPAAVAELHGMEHGQVIPDARTAGAITMAAFEYEERVCLRGQSDGYKHLF